MASPNTSFVHCNIWLSASGITPVSCSLHRYRDFSSDNVSSIRRKFGEEPKRKNPAGHRAPNYSAPARRDKNASQILRDRQATLITPDNDSAMNTIATTNSPIFSHVAPSPVTNRNPPLSGEIAALSIKETIVQAANAIPRNKRADTCSTKVSTTHAPAIA